jgi:hypothetical protein
MALAATVKSVKTSSEAADIDAFISHMAEKELSVSRMK